MGSYWTYSIDGIDYECEFNDFMEAHEAMQLMHKENVLCTSWEVKNNETYFADAEIIHFCFDENGEKEILNKHEIVAEYEHYHGDFIEHATY